MGIVTLRSLSPRLHPETERLLATDCWTRDPAVPVLAAAIRTLLPLGERMRALSADRPAIDRLMADEIGSLRSTFSETGRINIWEPDYRPSGTIACIWNELDALRHRWIAARLAVQGPDHSVSATSWYERLQDLEDKAPTLAQWWAAEAVAAD